MTLSYRLINNRSDLTRLIWDREELAPRHFQDASAVWHPTFESFETFWRECREVVGLLDDDKLLAAVYIEYITPVQVNVHVSVIEKVKEDDLVRFFKSLIRQHAIEGVEVITGWMTTTNRGLRRVAKAAGFYETQLRMIYGQSKGRPIEWIQMRA